MANYSEFESAISRGQDGAASNDGGQLDSAGQAILKLLHKAAGTAEANSRHALETAQKLSSQLRAAQDRIARARGARFSSIVRGLSAPKSGSHKISTEIEDRLINEPEEKRRQMSRRP